MSFFGLNPSQSLVKKKNGGRIFLQDHGLNGFAWIQGDIAVKAFARLFGRRPSNLVTEMERSRLRRTMPGETAAINAMRLGVLVA